MAELATLKIKGLSLSPFGSQVVWNALLPPKHHFCFIGPCETHLLTARQVREMNVFLRLRNLSVNFTQPLTELSVCSRNVGRNYKCTCEGLVLMSGAHFPVKPDYRRKGERGREREKEKIYTVHRKLETNCSLFFLKQTQAEEVK